MVGEGITPRGHDPMADVMPLDELRARFANMKSVIAKSVEAMPTHREFIARNCAAPPL
jgi:tryptophan halogenase